jgi:carboxyl-terminal processing protease
MNLNKIVQMIRGPKGTEVRLTIHPADESASPYVVSLIRDKINLEEQAAKARIIDTTGTDGRSVRLGIIDLPSFYGTMGGPVAGEGGASHDDQPVIRSASADVARLLTKLEKEKVDGVVLDMRDNPGGLLSEAVKLTSLFIHSGPVVQVRQPDNSVLLHGENTPPMTYDGPLVVLTSRFSASATEIVAAALQDYGRAVIVGGSSTFGKGTVQTIYDLKSSMPDLNPTNEPGALKVTIQKFYRVTGASTELKGVMPDIVLPSVQNYSEEVGEKGLENPIEWDTIQGREYKRFNLVRPYLTELMRRSNDRISTNRDFGYIREDIEDFKKHQADKTSSLNENERLKEVLDREARKKARDQERLARPLSTDKLYDISLQQADMQGLPAPTVDTNSPILLARARVGSVAGTNVVTASTTIPMPQVTGVHPAMGNDGIGDEDSASPNVDATLDETEHILEDYINLAAKSQGVWLAGTDRRYQFP